MRHNKSLKGLIGLVIVALFLFGCSTLATTPTVITAPSAPQTAPTSAPQKPASTATTALEVTKVQGVLIGKPSNKAIVGTHVLLCTIIDSTASEPKCLLRANLATVTTTDGKFEFANVTQGNYVVVYGLADEVKGSPQTWDGWQVHASALMMNKTGEPVDPFGGTKGVASRKSTVNIAGTGINVDDGPLTSGELGLSIEYRQSKPQVIVITTGQVLQVTIEVTER